MPKQNPNTILRSYAKRLVAIGPGRQALIGLFVVVALALPTYAAAGDQMPWHGSENGTFQLLTRARQAGSLST